VKVDNKLLFVIYRPLSVKDRTRFIDQWRELAVKNGLPGFYFVALLLFDEIGWNYRNEGFDGALVSNTFKAHFLRRNREVRNRAGRLLPRTLYAGAARLADHFRELTGRFVNVIDYEDAMAFFLDRDLGDPDMYPCVIPSWDNTSRSGRRGIVLHRSTPTLFKTHLSEALAIVATRAADRRIIFVKSWNEWAEGNYLEPDQRFGHQYLAVVRDVITGS
jgi:hypothetical protein